MERVGGLREMEGSQGRPRGGRGRDSVLHLPVCFPEHNQTLSRF